jgi:peptide/nickel transport system permease protein
MRPTDEDRTPMTGDPNARTDGGTPEIPLTSVSEESVTRRDRLEDSLANYWGTFLLAWSDWRFKIGLLIILGYVLLGTLGVYLVDEPTFRDGGKWDQPFQGGENLLGTNQHGESILGSLVHSTPDMLLMLLGGAVFATGVAAFVGILAGYKGGRVDSVLTTLTDTAMMIPGLPLIIVIAAIWEPTNPIVVGILVSINAWAGVARSLRSQVLTIREESYVEASRIMGSGSLSIMRRDITPQLLPLILINFVMSGRGVIFNSVALYFLGILPITSAENWGVMLNEAYSVGAVTSSELFYTLFFPLVAIVLLSWGLIMLSQGLDRVVNVRARARHEGEVNE